MNSNEFISFFFFFFFPQVLLNIEVFEIEVSQAWVNESL